VVVEGFFKANAVNEGDAQRDCVEEEEEEETFKANAVNEGDAERVHVGLPCAVLVPGCRPCRTPSAP
jgi:hypothetical protein